MTRLRRALHWLFWAYWPHCGPRGAAAMLDRELWRDIE